MTSVSFTSLQIFCGRSCCPFCHAFYIAARRYAFTHRPLPAVYNILPTLRAVLSPPVRAGVCQLAGDEWSPSLFSSIAVMHGAATTTTTPFVRSPRGAWRLAEPVCGIYLPTD